MELRKVHFGFAAEVADALVGSPLEQHAEFVTEFAHDLLFLHEEGRVLRPLIVLVSDATATSALMNEWPPGVDIAERGRLARHVIRFHAGAPFSASFLLKQVAPMAVGPWVPVVEVQSQTLSLLCLPSEAHWTTSELLHRTVGRVSGVTIEKVSDGVARIMSPTKELHLLADPRAEIASVGQSEGPVAKFAYALNGDRGGILMVVERLVRSLGAALDHCHGALLLVVREGMLESALLQCDSFVRVDDGIDMHGGDDPAIATAPGTRALRAALHAVLSMDGAVIFERGRIVAYRCLLKIPDSARAKGAGGARRLAYETARARQDLFASALCRSQDGRLRGFVRVEPSMEPEYFGD